MRESIQLQYKPTQQDYTNVLRLFFWRHTTTKLSLVVMVIAFIFVLYIILAQGTPPTFFELLWLFLPPLFVAYMFIMQPRRIAAQAAKEEQLMADVTWLVSAVGIEISSQFGTNLYDWASTSKMIESGGYYLLLTKTRKNAFRFIPQRAFGTPQDEADFRQLVQEYMPISR